MANILGLALKVTADGSGFNLDPIQRALTKLGDEADKVSGLFDEFAGSSSGAAQAQSEFEQRAQELLNTLRDNGSATKFTAEFAKLREEAEAVADLFRQGAQTTAQFATEQEKAEAKVAAFAAQLKVGAIEGPTFERALASIAGTDLSKTEEGRRLLEQLAASAKAGGLDAQQAATDLLSLGQSSDKLGKDLQQPTLKLNELSGVFAALPGPLGDIAGRFSGIVSAGEGLSRVFGGGGGVTSLFSGLSASVTALVNPFTLALAGITAFGAAATAITQGLIALSGRVEDLQNSALRLGTSFEFAQVLEEAAKRAGVSVDTLAGAMQKFAVRVDEARSGSGNAAKAFDELGISQQELINSNPTQIAERTAEALLKIEDPARRAALATDTLGKSGLELLPAFASVDDSREAIDRFSAAISSVDVERLNGVDDSFEDIRIALQGLSQNLLTPFAGLADGVASAIADAIGGFTNLLEPFLDRIQPFLDAIGQGFQAAGEIIFDVGTAAGSALEKLFTVIERLGTIVGAAVGKTIEFFSGLIEQFGEFTGLGSTISGVADAIAGAFQGLWDGIKNVVATIGGFVDTVLTFAEDWLGIKRQVEEPVVATVEINTDDAQAASEEFMKTMEEVAKSVESAKNESSKFGQAGFNAAVQYEQAVQELRDQLDAGILNQTSFKQGVEKATQAYEEQINAIEEAQNASTRRAEEEARAAQKIIDDNRKIADTLLEQQRIQKEFGGDNSRAKAAENVKAIEQEILRVEKEVQEARDRGDQAAVNAGVQRIANLDQIKAQEQDIASGAAAQRKAEEDAAKKRQAELDKLAEERERKEEEIRKLIEKNAEELAAKQEEYINRVYDLERSRVEEINNLRGGGIEVGDIRSNEGANTFLELLGGKQDEAIAEYRKSVKELQLLRKEVGNLAARPIEILGGVG